MKFGSLVGWGIVLYAIMFLTFSGFVLYGFVGGWMPRVCALVILIIVATIAGRSLRAHTWLDILPYSISWMVIVGLLDAVFSVPYSGWHMYSDPNIWVGYLLVAVVPLLAPYTRRISTSHPSSE